MGRQTATITIDDHVYTTTQLPARKGTRLFARASQGLLSLLSGGGVSAIATLDPSEVEALIDELFKQTFLVEGEKKRPLDQLMDDHFAGRYAHMVRVLAWLVGVNFADFLQSENSSETRKSEPLAKQIGTQLREYYRRGAESIT